MVSAKPGRKAGVRRFWRNRSGVAAVEFALLLPLMLTLYFGGVELGDALTINRKVTHVASTLSDLVTQSKSITPTDMSNIFDAAAAVMAPYPVSPLTMRLTGATIDDKNVVKVAWSQGSNTTALTTGAVLTVPAGVNQASTFLVIAEVHYPYAPTIGYVITGTFDLKSTFYLRPRISDAVCWNTTSC